MTTYAGPSVSAAYVTGIMNDAWANAGELDDAANTALARLAGSFPVGSRQPLLEADLFANNPRTLEREKRTAAEQTASGQAITTMNALSIERGKIVGDLTADMSKFMELFFGGLDVWFSSASTWLTAALADGNGSGVANEAALWSRDTVRIGVDAARAGADSTGMWATYGCAMPAAAAAAVRARAALTGRGAAASAARNMRIEQAKAEIENTQFAMEKGMQLRTSAMARCGTYITGWVASQYKNATERAFEDATHERELRESYMQYVRRELANRTPEMNIALLDHADKRNDWSSEEDRRVRIGSAAYKMLLTEAQSLATRAAGAIAAIHVGASVSGSESA